MSFSRRKSSFVSKKYNLIKLNKFYRRFEMDKVWDLVTEVKARAPKTILDLEIPEKIKNPPLWLKVPDKNLTLFKKLNA